jgi:hypothetical protein
LTAGTIVAANYLRDQPDANTALITLVETALLVISLCVAIFELVKSKDIAHATFITELNKAFVENSDYIKVYNHLQNCADDCCDCENSCADKNDLDIDNCNLPITKGQISNYLTFFETIYILFKKDVIDFKTLNDLFAYRFFLVVHSKIAQQKKLKLQPENFKNIFCLEYCWLEYRRNLERKKKENRKKKDSEIAFKDTPETVYGRLLLKDLVNEETYKRMINGCKPKLKKEKEKPDASVQK